jgi:hypothetical protein
LNTKHPELPTGAADPLRMKLWTARSNQDGDYSSLVCQDRERFFSLSY